MANILLSSWADINAKNNDSITPLHIAVYKSNFNMTKYLLKKNADVNVQDRGGFTPLHFICSNGLLMMFDLLETKDPYNNMIDNNGYMPLHYAVMGGYYEIADKLILYGADKDAQVKKINPERVVKFFIGEDSEDPHYGYTPLHFAVAESNIDIIKLLMKRKANPNYEANGVLPYELALSNGNTNIAEMLFKYGARMR